jgi:dinuclear metal center YbgI/SA1388 family protein
MALLSDIDIFLKQEFSSERYKDAALNGLQIEGSPSVSSIAVAVDAALSTVQAAISKGAQLLFVHHGLFWGAPLAVTKSHRDILRTALAHDLSLYALHLPLDAHLSLGNNAQLAAWLALDIQGPAAEYQGQHIGVRCSNPQRLTLAQLKTRLGQLPGANSDFVSLPFGPDIPERICITSGSACDLLYRFESEDFDTLITGEPKQFAYHFCKANRLNALFPGHYASETLGIQAVGAVLQQRFAVAQHFIDEPTGI